MNTYKHNGGNNRAVFAQALEPFQLYAIDIMDIVQLKKVDGSGLTADLLDLLLGLREELRRARNFELADRIRDELTELGVTIEDTPQGPRWKV